MAEEAQDWRIERYSDETDPFTSIQWYVMRGNIVIAQCEVEANADRILHEHLQRQAYARALARIAAMTGENGITEAIEAARGALDDPK